VNPNSLADPRPGGADPRPHPDVAFLPDVRLFWARLFLGPTDHQRVQLYQELAGMTAAGIGIREALEGMLQRHGRRTGRVISCLSEAVQAGNTMAPAMAARPDLFSGLEAGLVRAGERTGPLDHAFNSVADAVERRKKIRNQIVAGVAYPLLLIHFGLFVMPLGFILVRSGLGAYLAFVIPIFLLLWGVIFAAASLHGGLSRRVSYGRFILAVPIFGAAARYAAVTRFARALSALNGAGTDAATALVDAAHAGGNAWMTREIEQAATTVLEGNTLAHSLLGNPALPQEVWNSIASGEQAGELEAALSRTADVYEEKFRTASRASSGALFVLMMGLVALMVMGAAWNVISDYLAAFNSVV